MAGRKEYRDLTVGDIYRNGKSVPMLRVSGLWLEELGRSIYGRGDEETAEEVPEGKRRNPRKVRG